MSKTLLRNLFGLDNFSVVGVYAGPVIEFAISIFKEISMIYMN
jgi:hypothetical protein